MEVRKINPDDMPMLHGWAEERGCTLLEPLLSPYGFLAVDDSGPVMCCWGYMILDVPVIQVDHVFVRPHCKPSVGRAAWDDLLSAIRAWLLAINEKSGLRYILIESFINPVMEREVKRTGGLVSNRSYKRAHYTI